MDFYGQEYKPPEQKLLNESMDEELQNKSMDSVVEEDPLQELRDKLVSQRQDAESVSKLTREERAKLRDGKESKVVPLTKFDYKASFRTRRDFKGHEDDMQVEERKVSKQGRDIPIQMYLLRVKAAPLVKTYQATAEKFAHAIDVIHMKKNEPGERNDRAQYTHNMLEQKYHSILAKLELKKQQQEKLGKNGDDHFAEVEEEEKDADAEALEHSVLQLGEVGDSGDIADENDYEVIGKEEQEEAILQTKMGADYLTAVMQLDSWLKGGEAEKLMSAQDKDRQKVLDRLVNKAMDFRLDEGMFTPQSFDKNGETIMEMALFMPAVLELVQQENLRSGYEAHNKQPMLESRTTAAGHLCTGWNNYVQLQGVTVGDVRKGDVNLENYYLNKGRVYDNSADLNEIHMLDPNNAMYSAKNADTVSIDSINEANAEYVAALQECREDELDYRQGKNKGVQQRKEMPDMEEKQKQVEELERKVDIQLKRLQSGGVAYQDGQDVYEELEYEARQKVFAGEGPVEQPPEDMEESKEVRAIYRRFRELEDSLNSKFEKLMDATDKLIKKYTKKCEDAKAAVKKTGLKQEAHTSEQCRREVDAKHQSKIDEARQALDAKNQEIGQAQDQNDEALVNKLTEEGEKLQAEVAGLEKARDEELKATTLKALALVHKQINEAAEAASQAVADRLNPVINQKRVDAVNGSAEQCEKALQKEKDKLVLNPDHPQAELIESLIEKMTADLAALKKVDISKPRDSDKAFYHSVGQAMSEKMDQIERSKRVVAQEEEQEPVQQVRRLDMKKFDSKAAAPPGYKERKAQKKQRARAKRQLGTDMGVTHRTGALLDGIQRGSADLETEGYYVVMASAGTKIIKPTMPTLFQSKHPDKMMNAATAKIDRWTSEAERIQLSKKGVPDDVEKKIYERAIGKAIGTMPLTEESFSAAFFTANAQNITVLNRGLGMLLELAENKMEPGDINLLKLRDYNNKFKALYYGYTEFLACNGITKDGNSIYQNVRAGSALDYQQVYQTQLNMAKGRLQYTYQGYHKTLKESVV